MSMDFRLGVNNCLKISYYIFDLENIAGQYNFQNWSIWHLDGTLTGTNNPGQSGTGINDNEKIFHTPESFRSEPSLSDGLVS